MSVSKFEYIIKEEDLGVKIKSLLRAKYGFSTRLLNKLKVNGGVFLDGEPVKTYIEPICGQKITVDLPEETSDFTAEDIPLDIVHEDADLLIINKQPGYVVHPTKGHPNHTMANGIMKYILDSDQQFKIRFINRLDMDTTGLLIIAKNSHAQNDITKQMKENKVIKKYIAIVKGHLPDDGRIDLPIGKAEEGRVERMVRDDGAPSVTNYKTIERYTKQGVNRNNEHLEHKYSLVELILETGRTHQIRVHMSHIGHPVVGDSLYGGAANPLLIERQALHAKYLFFKHPVKRTVMEVEASMPQDMLQLIEKIK